MGKRPHSCLVFLALSSIVGSPCVAQTTVARFAMDPAPRSTRPTVETHAADPLDPAIETFDFGRAVAGTFLGQLTVGESGPAFFDFVMTLHADGTLESSDSVDSVQGFESPSFGVWHRTGERELTIRQLYLRYDTSGNLVLVGRDTFAVEFDAALGRASGTATGEALLPEDVLDPLDPDGGEAILSSTSSLRMERLAVDIPWGSEDGDDDPDTAVPIDCPGFVTQDAAIETFDDVDFFVLSGAPGQTVRVDVDTFAPSSRLDTILGAFDPELNLIAASDDDPAPGEPLSFDSYLSTTMPPGGRMFIAVAPFAYPFGFEGPGYSFGPYALDVACAAPGLAPAVGLIGPLHPTRPVPQVGTKPAVRFRGTWAPKRQAGSQSFGRDRQWAGTYLAVESGFFGEVHELLTLYGDGTFSVQFEGAQRTGSAVVRGDCLGNGKHQRLCEGLDRLISSSGRTVLLDRISWVLDAEPMGAELFGHQVGFEIFQPSSLLDPPDPNVSVEDDGFVAFGIGNVLPQIRPIKLPADRLGRERGSDALGFGKRVAGTFVGAVGTEGGPPSAHFLALLGADGTFVASDTDDFLNGGIDGPLRGVWQRAGPRRIEARAIGLPEASSATIERIALVIEFDSELGRVTGTWTRETYLRSQILDPLDPNTDQPPLEASSLGLSMTRLSAPRP